MRSIERRDLQTNLTRREFIKGVGLTGAAVLFKSGEVLNRPLTSSEKIYFAQELYGPEFRGAKSVKRSAVYQLENDTYREIHTPRVHDTNFVTLGDSIARGFYGVKDTYHPSIETVVQTVNDQWQGTAWNNTMCAQEWHTIDDVVNTQLPQAKKVFTEKKNIEINICVGGNDVVGKFLSNTQMVSDLDVIRQGKFVPNSAWALVGQYAMQEVEQFQQKFASLLQEIRIQDEYNHIKRIHVQSLPDISKATAVEYNSPSGKLVFPIEGKVVKRVAANLPFLLNVAMKRAIDHVGGDILLLNNFDIVKQGELNSVHPNKDGQDEMAKYHLTRLMGQTPDKSLYPLYRSDTVG